MAWQKTKIILSSVEKDEDGKKVHHRYVVTKSKGAGKPNTGEKLKLKKYNPVLRKHVEYTETKYK